MKNRILFSVLIIALVSVSGCSKNDQLLRDFAKFDRTYIAVLFLTNVEKPNPSKKAIEKLKTEWNIFKEKYYVYNKEDFQWSKDFDNVEQSIMQADKIISSGRKLVKAHEILENVRYTFIKTRRRNNIDYYIDYLTDFHEPMEHIVLRVKGKTPKTLKANDIKFIEKNLPEALKLWDALLDANFNQDLFLFNDEKVTKMHGIIQAETKTLEELKSAINNKSNKANLIKKTVGIKKNFALLFKQFGDFKGLEK